MLIAIPSVHPCGRPGISVQAPCYNAEAIIVLSGRGQASASLSTSDSPSLDRPAWFRSLAIHANISLDRTEAALSLVSEFAATRRIRAAIRAEITQDRLPVADVEDPITLFESDTTLVQSTTIPRLRLWYPNGEGAQPLYEARLALVGENGQVLDSQTLEFGIRQVDAVRCDDSTEDGFPYRLTVNGVPLWIRGWDWLPSVAVSGPTPSEWYARALSLARGAGVNMLRVAGGGPLESAEFFRECNRHGIMVWQELPSNGSEGDLAQPDPAIADWAASEAEAIIRRQRHHPCLVIWGPRRADLESSQPHAGTVTVLAALQGAVESEDPQRLWVAASPCCARPRRPGDLARICGESSGSLAVPALASLPHIETLRTIFDGKEPALEPAHPVWRYAGGLQGHLRDVEAAFGPVTEIADLIRAGQHMQAAALQYAIEAARRRCGATAGAIPYSFNETEPEPIGSSAVDWYGRVKPAYYAVKRAYERVHVSARFAACEWAECPAFEADVWLHNSGKALPLLNVVAQIMDLNGREWYQENLAAEAPEGASEPSGDVSWRFPPDFQQGFVLFLEVIDEEGDTVARSAYLHSRAPAPAFSPFLSTPETTLTLSREGGEVQIRNTGGFVALGVNLDAGAALVEDGDFPLAPGRSRRLQLLGEAPQITLSAWNAVPVRG